MVVLGANLSNSDHFTPHFGSLYTTEGLLLYFVSIVVSLIKKILMIKEIEDDPDSTLCAIDDMPEVALLHLSPESCWSSIYNLNPA